MVTPGTVENRLLPYTEVKGILPNWFWHIARASVFAVTLGFVSLLITDPEFGLSLFWKLLMPSLPIVFAAAPGLWRQICPMAFLNQLPRQMGFTMGKTLPLPLKESSYILAALGFFGLISLRHVNLNAIPMAFFTLVVLALMFAFIGGVVFKGRSGWCGTFCPLSPIQKLYGHAPIIYVRNGYCEPCVGCQKNCYDFNPRAAIFSDLDDSDPWYVGHRRFFVAGLPGMVLGFSQASDPAKIGLSAYFLELGITVLLSMGLFFVLTSLLRCSLYKIVALYGAVSLILFYWFAAPIMVATVVSLGLPLPSWTAHVFQAAVVGITASILFSGYRNERAYEQQSSAADIPLIGVNVENLKEAVAAENEGTVTEQSTGQSFPANRNKSLLEALESEGLKIDFGCRMGMCGADPVTIIDGHENLSEPTEEELATLRRLGLEGQARMACVCRALKGPVSIDIEQDPHQSRKSTQKASASDPSKKEKIKHVVIIGNGAAGITMADSIRQASPSCKIDVISRERRNFYNRMAIGRMIYGRSAMDGLYLMSPDWYEEKDITVWLNTIATKIDRKKKKLHLGTGESLLYDRLVLAQGSHAWIPPVKGADLPGCFVLREADDAMAIRSWSQREDCKKAVVIGGGVLGIEAADALRQYGLSVTILHRSGRLMDRQLDKKGSEILQHFLEGLGVNVITNAEIKAVKGQSCIEGLDFGKDGILQAELCVFCVGVRPNIELAEAAGLKVNRGVLVDRKMQTTDKNIFAVGDVAELPDSPSGLWTVSTKQAQIAADALFGQGDKYKAPRSLVQLKVDGVDVMSFGRIEIDNKGQEQIADDDEQDHERKMLIVDDGKIIGAVFVGPPGTSRDVGPVIQKNADVSAIMEQLRTGDWSSLKTLDS